MQSTASAFAIIFIAEWGDLTQFATATLAARYGAPLTIFVAATLALWAVAAIGIAIGHAAGRAVQPRFVERIAAAALGGVGVFLLVSS